MAQLIVRNIDAATVVALKRRAAGRGRSMEAEHREILRSSLQETGHTSLKALLGQMPDVGKDADFARPVKRPRRVRL